MKLLELNNVSIRFGHKFVVKDVSWEIQEGENWAFLGLNGCGKTTLLSLLAGYMGPTSGTIKICGTEVTNNNHQLLRQTIGFVSSSFFNKVFTNEQVLDIVLSGKTESLYPNLAEVSMKDVQQARSLLDIYQLGDSLRYSYDMLSKGQQQCVLLARAQMKENRLLILDEPCEGLDILRKDLFLQQIKKYAESGVGIIYVTHHTEELSNIFHKACFMRDGTLHSTGSFNAMFTEQNLEDFFQRKVNKTVQENRIFLNFGWTKKLH